MDERRAQWRERGWLRKGKEKRRESRRAQGGERNNHVCPAEVTTGLQVLIMC